MYRRNSVIRRNQCCEDRPVSAVIHINGRYPQSGERSNQSGDSLIYVMKGSGMVGGALKAGLKAGNVVRVKRGEPFYLKGQFAVYLMSVA